MMAGRFKEANFHRTNFHKKTFCGILLELMLADACFFLFFKSKGRRDLMLFWGETRVNLMHNFININDSQTKIDKNLDIFSK